MTLDIGALYPELKGRRVRGRLVGKTVVPYWSRADISSGKLTGSPRVLAWADDAVEAFFMERTLNAQIPSDKKAPDGQYTVIVQYKVDKEGNISNITALTNHGYGMEQEVIRVVAKGPKWQPAIQNGRTVASIRKQPVTFVVIKDDEPEKKKKKNKD